MPEPIFSGIFRDYERDPIERELGIRHADGTTWWNKAPLPRYWHRCRPWTTSPEVHRCPCGGLRHVGDRFWIYRNSERKGRT